VEWAGDETIFPEPWRAAVTGTVAQARARVRTG
jgi:hypothetical protein